MKCADKIAYNSRGEAYANCFDKKRLSVYECPFCHKFHITHKKRERHIKQQNNVKKLDKKFYQKYL